jgi:DNA recombination protein Rad52
MTFAPEIVAELQKKLDPGHVKPPQKFGPKGDYLEGWHVIAEANRIFGFGGWSYEVVDTKCVAEKPREIGQQKRDGWGVTYTSRVRVDVSGVVREDFGAGHGYDVDLGLAHESAIKEAVTDALKRTLRTFGNPFGLALYDKSRANVGHADEPATPKPTSAAEMKRGLDAIEQDLLDCHSLSDWAKCVKIWAAIMDRDGWTKDYRDAARPKFAARKQSLTDDENPFDVPPNGDAYRNAKDGKPAPVNVLAAG